MISVVWGNPGNNQLFNVYVDGSLAVSSTGATLSNVACAYYTIPATEGTHTVKVTSTLNGKETTGVSQTVTVSGSSSVETTTPPTSNLDGYVAAGAIEICYSSPTDNALGNAEVYVDSMNNKVATIELVNNGTSWSDYSVTTAKLDSEITSGSHSIYLRFVTTGNVFHVANVDYFRFVKVSEVEADTVVIASEGLEINGYQISASVEGMRTVYSVESTINGKEVVASGLVYSLAEYASLSDMYVGSESKYVANFESTVNGACSRRFSDSETATSYAMTMTFAAKNAAEYNTKWRIRAYAKLSDGTYVYTECEEYQIYDIADKLYQKELMSYKAAHDYLYTDILTVVKPNYEEIKYSMDNILAKW